MAEVEVDENGLPISPNATSYAHLKGSLVRTIVPISYKTWKHVNVKYKNDIWNELQKSYRLPESCKITMVKEMSGPWRRRKYELRRDYYDPYNTYEERIQHIPPNVKEEEWIEFCKNESTEKAQERRAENKRKRALYDHSHTTGRKSHSQVKVELERENPDVEISTSDVWIKAHTQVGGEILPSAQKYFDELKKPQEDIKEKKAAGVPVSNIDVMAQVFQKECRGRVRAVGPVTRTQYDYSAPARAKVQELKSKDGAVKYQLDDLGTKVGILIESLGTLCHTVKDIQSAMPGSFVASNNSGCLQGHAASPVQNNSVTHARSPAETPTPSQTPSPGQTISPARSSVGAEMPLCSLLNIEEEVLAVGRLCTGAQGRMCHDTIVPANLGKVLVDKILMPYANVIKANKFADTFGDVGVGGYVLHPKACIRND